ncbi:NADH-quinone oxidoreductase subunit C [Streptomyces sp. NPDC001137]|uniref:NADH-quinone oxidoreductase subunit C n=1 Tax=Streptomyces sp. NPDC001137 TaxID=3154378 RepID=UPI00332FA704
MSTVGWLPAPADELFGTEATAEESYELLTVDVPPATWVEALEVARDRLSCTYFDWLSAVDEPGTGFRVSAHVVSLSPVRRLLLRTTVPHEAPTLASAVGVYAGAAWHERETHEMFGVVFEGHPALDHLLLPETFEGHPLRKDFVLAARVAKAWPGAKEPGESDHGGPKRRQMLPPGVPDPNEWGPLKGQLPPAPARPTRAAGRPPADRAAADRPVRRARSAAQGSASQAAPAPAEGAEAAPAAPRRARSAAEGSASQAGSVPAEGAEAAPAAPRRARSAAEGSASQAAPTPVEGASADRQASTPAAGASADQEPGASGAATPRRTHSAGEGSASQAPRTQSSEAPTTRPAPAPRSSDAPWHHARPAFDEPETGPSPETEPKPEKESRPESERSLEGEAPAENEPRPAAKSNPHAAPEDPSAEDPTPNPEDPAGGTQ